ncbi:inositol-3-phosphate synthase [Methanolacinia paynteri]|uniref:inositol-3-phosphate synthase n=1 Tax=Methanolacinia paynteri TaxID=230356 RepID=UPI00064FD69D|nr:inositol-3-phosphate synthase [Methanolacinia paynteri]
MSNIKIAIAGIGNCASSLIQGLCLYKTVDRDSGLIPGILHNEIENYKISDIECVAAFDINEKKVGKDVSEAIFTEPNNAIKFSEVPFLDVTVKQGPVLDGLGYKLSKIVKVNSESIEVNVADELKKTGAEILINLLPTGSVRASEFYAEQALIANCSFINAIPVFIASKKEWSKKFEERNLPVVGDDIKSQIGATILHRTLVELLLKRGIYIENSSQKNIGGNSDFVNLSEKNRLQYKRISKTEAIESIIPYNSNIVVLDPEYSPELKDVKKCNIEVNCRNFGNLPVKINLDLEVEDSPNSAGVMIDVIRSLKLARDKNLSGSINDISSFFFKHPEIQIDDNEAYQKFEAFIKN